MATSERALVRTHNRTQRGTAYPATAQLATPTDLEPDAVQDITLGLNQLIADTFALYVKTKNFHWHLAGSHFRDYHLLFDEQVIVDYLELIGEDQWVVEYRRLNRLRLCDFHRMIADSSLRIKWLRAHRETTGRFPALFPDRLACYNDEDLRCSQIRCLLQKAA